jgi:2-polyprenyl-3-methyl-5-hydroxy-6-metoxy-1,4-benzoquinol methylase
LHGNAVAAADDHLYCSLAWMTCSMPQRCTTRIICTFFAAPGGSSEFAVHGPAVPDADVPGETVAELTWRLLELRPGMSVLDLACGHGELANLLAARGLPCHGP